VEATRHYAAIGIDVPHFEELLRWCQIHIGLEGQANVAYAGNWTDLQATDQHTLDVATCRVSIPWHERCSFVG
jgi:hypothetical protein